MSRTLKRVPLSFKWPMHMVWKGYLNPFRFQECKACNGTGLNPETKKLSDDWYTHSRTDGQKGWAYHLEQEDVQALLDADRLWEFTRVPRTSEQNEIVKKKIQNGGNSWLPHSNGYTPTAQEVNEWARYGFGHDGINQSICVKAKARRLGFYGLCCFCKGDGKIWQSKRIKDLHDKWRPFSPPKGEGFQLWEDVTEGSPVSPVFSTFDALCEWCAENATTFADFKATKEEWQEMLDKDFVYHQEGNNVFF